MKKLMALLFLCTAPAVFAQTTPNLGLQLPNYNTPNWGVALNYNFSRIDGYLSGAYTLPAFDANGLTLANITGATQCLQVNSQGVIGGTGAICGASGLPGTANQLLFSNGTGGASASAATADSAGNISTTGSVTAGGISTPGAVAAGTMKAQIANNVIDVAASCPTPGTYDQTCWSAAISKGISQWGSSGFTVSSGAQTYIFTAGVTVTGTNIALRGAGSGTVITWASSGFAGGTPFTISNSTNVSVSDMRFVAPVLPTRVVVANGVNQLPQSGYICIDRWGTGNCYVPTVNDSDLIPTASGGSCSGSACLSASPQQWNNSTNGPQNTLQIEIDDSSNVSVSHISGDYAEITASGVDGFTADHNVMTGGAQQNNWGTIAVIPPAADLAITSVAASSNGSAVYTGTITGGASNALAGKWFSITGDTANLLNNGVFYCSASTTTTLTLLNPNAVAETIALVGQQLNTNISITDNTIMDSSYSGISVRAAANVVYSQNNSSFEGESGLKIGQDAGNYVFYLQSADNITHNNHYDGFDYEEQAVEQGDNIDCGGCSSSGDVTYLNGTTGMTSNGLHWNLHGLATHDNGTYGLLERWSDSTINGVEAWHNRLSGSGNQVGIVDSWHIAVAGAPSVDADVA